MTAQTKPHILIVDDDIRILKLLSQFLSQNGYLVSAAHSAKEAEEYLGKFTFDLVILDVMMPEVTGIEFAHTIKINKIHVPIILLTALSETEDKIKGLEAGADDYITKPFEAKELLLRTKKLIDLYGYNKKAGPNEGTGFQHIFGFDYTKPWSIIESATFTKPAMLAPFT
jgi:two-component system phosphate regulon response regulator OmpR